MALQTARYLIASLRSVRRGDAVHGSVRYLADVRPRVVPYKHCAVCGVVTVHVHVWMLQDLPTTWGAVTVDDVRSSDHQLLALRAMAAFLVKVRACLAETPTSHAPHPDYAWSKSCVLGCVCVVGCVVEWFSKPVPSWMPLKHEASTNPRRGTQLATRCSRRLACIACSVLRTTL